MSTCRYFRQRCEQTQSIGNSFFFLKRQRVHPFILFHSFMMTRIKPTKEAPEDEKPRHSCDIHPLAEIEIMQRKEWKEDKKDEKQLPVKQRVGKKT